MADASRDYITLAEADGASFRQMQTGAWRALDRRAFVIVDGAESLAEAARLYCEDRGLPKAKPAMPDAILAGIRAEYAPYDAMPAFDEGFAAWPKSRFNFCNPHTPDSVEAQAWDRGLECAMRYQRAVDAAERGSVVERNRLGKAVR